MRLVPEEPRSRAAFSLSDAEQGQDIRSPQTKASAGTGKPEAGLPPADPDETREMPLKRETPLRPLAAIRLTEKRNGTGTPLLDQMASPPHAVDQFNKFYSYLPMVYPQVKAMFLFDVDLSISQFSYALSGSGALASAYRPAVSGGAFLQGDETQGAAYTRLSTVNEPMDTLNLYTYASFPGTGSATCRYTLDGAAAYTSTSEPFAYSLDVSSLSSGSHTITATVTKGNFSI